MTLDGPRPISTSDSLSSSAASTCQLEAFCTFIKLADLETINVFLTTATLSPRSQNLKALWDHAFKEGYESCVEETQTQFKNQFDMVTEDLNTQHEETIQHVLADISECQQDWCDEQYVEAFTLGRTTGIQEECEYRDSVCKNQIDVGIQVRPTTATASVQKNSPIILQSSASISTQTKPMLLLSKNFSKSSPVPISKSPIPANSDSAPFNWASDSILLSTLPMIPSNQPRNLSSLRSSSKTPFPLFVIVTIILNVHNSSLHNTIPSFTKLIHLFIKPHHFHLIGIMIHAFSSSAMF